MALQQTDEPIYIGLYHPVHFDQLVIDIRKERRGWLEVKEDRGAADKRFEVVIDLPARGKVRVVLLEKLTFAPCPL
jgi:hypothetical protein